MIGSALDKAAWAGRTASMVFGLALVLALVFGAVSVGLAANGKPFILGKAANVATKATGLVGRVAAGEALVVKNPSGGSALSLSVGDPLADPAAKTVAPMKVDSQAKVGNLNADKLDGKDSSELLGTTEKAADSETLDGKDSSEFAPAYRSTVVVSPVGTDTENGTALLDALDGITDASATRPYLIYIEPGTYDLGTSALQMKEHVDVEGAGQLRTLITGGFSGACTGGTVRGADNAELRFLTVRNTGASCVVAIHNSSASPRLTHVTVEATGTGASVPTRGILSTGGSPTMTGVTATASGGADNIGVLISSGSPTMTDLTAIASGGIVSTGVRSASGSPTMTGITATAAGATENYGVRTSGSGSPTIRQSKLSGSTNSLLHQGTTSITKVAITQLVGPVEKTAGFVHCFNNYDDNMAAVTCP